MSSPVHAALADATPASSPDAAARFRSWQTRTLIATIVGYAAFYIVRKNLSVAMPKIGDDLGITKADLGFFLSAHGVLYGVSRFANGIWGDRANARYFMLAGLMLSVAANVFFGFSSTVLLLGIAWMINGWVQGMGFPPCCRLMTHWFPPDKLATKMSIWNTSHSIGAWITLAFCGFIVERGGWRWCFFGPAILCTVAGLALFILLRDTPSSVGLPEIHEKKKKGALRPLDQAMMMAWIGLAAGIVIHLMGLKPGFAAGTPGLSKVGWWLLQALKAGVVGWLCGFVFGGIVGLAIGFFRRGSDEPAEESGVSAEHKRFVRQHVYGNPYLWWISLANFFVYILRFAVLDWGPTLLKEMKGFSLQHASWMVIGFEAAGMIGMLIAGWVTDRFFGGRGSRTCVFCMIGGTLALLAFWKIGHGPWLAVGCLGLAGFFIYGPQALIGITAANLATNRAAATAAGFTGLFGYASTIVSGWGLGKLVQESGWNAAFAALMGVGALGMLMFVFAWPAKAHGYAEQKTT